MTSFSAAEEEVREIKTEHMDFESELVSPADSLPSCASESHFVDMGVIIKEEEDLGVYVEEPDLELPAESMSICASSNPAETGVVGKKAEQSSSWLPSTCFLPAHDIVCNLLELPFTLRSDPRQKDIVGVGRPTPQLTILQEDSARGRKFTRSFNADYFRKCGWLCSSFYKQALFCWPCLLFEQNQRQNTVWSSVGYCNYKNLPRGISRHENSKDHIAHHCLLKKMEKNRSVMEESLMEHAILSEAQFNENVRMNRRVMRILIDAVIYLGKQQLVLSEPESTDSSNKGNYKELVALLLKSSSSEIQARYKTIAPVFTGGSETIQAELINCVQEVIRERIEADLKGAPFFSCQLVDTTGMAHETQNATIVRFVDGSGRIVERFLGFFDVSENEKTSGLFNLLHSQLQKFKYEKKLIGQTFGGAIVTTRELTQLQTQVKSVAPSALLTHCSDRRLSLVLQNGTRNIAECRNFFSHAVSMATYFRESPLRSSVADEIIKRRHPQIVGPCWYSRSKVVQQIYQYFPDLRTIFNAIVDDPLQSAESRTRAVGFLHILSQFDFAFLTVIFQGIFDKADVLFENVLQKKSLDIRHCFTRVETFKSQLIAQRNEGSANDYFSKAVELFGLACESGTNADDFDFIEAKRSLYFDVITNIVSQLTETFCDMEKLTFLELVDSSKFSKYCSKFPDAALEPLRQFYAAHFPDFPRLKCELEVVYDDALFRKKSVQGIIEAMRLMDLHPILKEAYKLMLLVASISASTVSTNGSFSAFGRIEACMLQESASSVTFLSIEKELLGEMMTKEDFYVQVIQKFDSKKSRKIDLTFKS